MDASVAMQRYAAEIYRLEEKYDYVPLSELADHVDVSLQAASRMIRRLKEANIIEHEPYKGVRLTESGHTVAMSGLRRHRIAELYLVEVMGFRLDEVHDLTHAFEEGLTPVIEERMSEMLGHPMRCPHGEPIPDAQGQLPKLLDGPLVSFSDGVRATISRIRSHEPKKLRYFAELNMHPGTPITIVRQAPFEGPVRIAIEGRGEQVLGYQLASAVWIEPIVG